MSEIERLKVVKLDSDVRFADLKRKEQATQQGYEQMCERKNQSDMKAVTLEAQLQALEMEMEESRESLRAGDSSVALPSPEMATERSQSRSPTIEIVTYNQQLSETDRLDMITRRWRNDLQSAVEQQEIFKESLKDTESQIVMAINQLEEIQGPKTRGVRGKKSKKALKNTKAQISVATTQLEDIQGPATLGVGASSSAANEVAPQIHASLPPTPQFRANDIVLEPWMRMDKPATWGTWADMDDKEDEQHHRVYVSLYRWLRPQFLFQILNSTSYSRIGRVECFPTIQCTHISESTKSMGSVTITQIS